MDLVLWRHAEAYDLDAPQDAPKDAMADLARELTPRGAKQAARMAAWLDRQLPESTKVFASPAVRADQTARALSRKFKIRSELSPSAQHPDLLQVAQWPDSDVTVLLVGHQPSLGALIAHLLHFEAEQCAVKKGAVWWLRTRERNGHTETVVVTVQTPEYL
jgi:phosphohistidine phosphatase